MKIKILDLLNEKKETFDVSDKIMKQKINYKLIKNVIDWQLNHSKPRTAMTKQRNKIKGSQKGSGGARHASRKAPIFVGGGVAHGPKGFVYKEKKINKKIRKMAIAQILTKKNEDKSFYLLADIKKEIKKQKCLTNF